MLRKSSWIVLCVIVAGSLVLSGCGTPPPAVEPTTSGQPATAPTSSPMPGASS